MTTRVPIRYGGTGANTASAARTSLGAAPSAAYDQANAAIDQANTARNQANTARDTANGAYAVANTGAGGIVNAYAQANNARDQANTARDTANGAYGQANGAYAHANIVYAQANTARDQANTARTTANDAYGQANTARTTANDAYGAANTAGTNALNAYGQANNSRDQANTARDQANTARDTANGAYAQANGAYAQANGAYAQANTAANTVAVYANDTVVLAKANVNFNNSATVNISVTANSTTGRANVDFTANSTALGIPTINAHLGTINTTFGTVNTNITTANTQANNARDQANTARDTANGAYGQANGAYAHANIVYGQANTAYGQANSARDQANSARDQANTARTQANNAYAEANLKLNLTGGAINGDLTITGNLSVTGSNTLLNVSNLSVNDSIIFLANGQVGDAFDIGFVGHFDRGANATHAGLIRKASVNEFFLFDSYEVEPTNNIIDINGQNFRLGNVRVNTINANSVLILGNTAATQANLTLAHNQANTARDQANSARDQANTARTTANDAYGTANTAGTNALNAYSQANTARDQANTARDQANTARTQANTAYGQANDAYAAANTRVLKAGDTMTGQLVMSGTSIWSKPNSTGNNGIALQLGRFVDIDQPSYTIRTDDANGDIMDIVSNRYNMNFRLRRNSAVGEQRVAEIDSTSGQVTNLILTHAFESDNTQRVQLSTNSHSFINANSSSANFGIGIASPTSKLHVIGTANVSSTTILGSNATIGSSTASASNSQVHILSNRQTTAYGLLLGTFNGASFENDMYFRFTGSDGQIGNFQNFPLAFITNASEKMRIAANGDVSIGTTSGGHKLRVSGSVLIDQNRLQVTNTTDNVVTSGILLTGNRNYGASDNGGIQLIATGSGGTLGTHDYGAVKFSARGFSGVADGGGSIVSFHVGGSSSNATSNGMFIQADGTTNIVSNVRFFTGNAPVERMRIDSAGNVGIGTSNPTSNLHVVGNANISVSINTATLNATTVNAQTFVTSTGANVFLAAINAYGQANLAYTQANSAYGQANLAYTQANNAYTQANNAYGQANLAYTQANSAFSAANNRVLKAGDTMTGQLNISSGGLLVTGNVGIGTASPTVSLDVNGAARFRSGYIGGDTQGYPDYDFLLDFGSDVANTWRKLVTITSPTGQYVTIGFKIDIVDPQGNHAYIGTQNQIRTETYYVACVRTNDTVQDTPDACYVSGPSDRIRAIKTATGAYEIQIQNAAQYVEYRGKITVYAVNGSHTVVYSNGTAVGTATATYTATQSTSGQQRISGTLFVSNAIGVNTTSPTSNLHVIGTANVSANLTVSAGSAAAPAITTAGDNNTGIFFPAADTIAFAEGGSEAMRIDDQGRVSIGATSFNGVGSLRAKRNITGAAFGYGVLSDGVVQSDVTSAAYYFRTDASTFANTTPYTLSNIIHYQAEQQALGANTTLTNQYGFAVSSSLTGATNNYGFHSALAAAANRWNFFASGTANNYFAGNIGINTTTPAARLVVQDGVTHTSGAPTNRGSIILSNSGGSTSTAGGLEFHGSVFSNGYGWRIATPDESGGSVPLVFQRRADSASWTETVRFSSAGNVGIGTTTTTSARLTVSGANTAEGQVIVSNDGSALHSAGINFHTGIGTNRGYVGWRGGSSTSPFTATGIHLFNTDNSNLILGTNNLERMRINSTGDVSIGTTTAFTIGGTAGLTILNSSVALAFGANSSSMMYARHLSDGNFQFQTNSTSGANSGNLHLQPYGGNVGIGTTSPAFKLDVYGGALRITETNGGAAVLLGNASISGANNQYQYINFGGDSGGQDAWQIGKKNNTADSVGPAKGFYIYDLKNTAARFVIDQSGNLGIGTTSPAHKLDVNGASIFRDTLNFGSGALISWTTGYSDGTTQTFNSPSSGSLAFITNSNLAMFIKSNQNVGIGTTSPEVALHISRSVTNSAAQIYFDNPHISTSLNTSFDLVGRFIRDGGQLVDAGFIRFGKGGTYSGVVTETNGFMSFHVRETWSVSSPPNSVERMRITNTGNVGIANTNPQRTLTVGGTVESTTGGFRFPDGTTQTTAASSVTGIPTLNIVSGTTVTAAASNHYVLTNASLTTVTLPASPNAGDIVWVTVGNNRTDNVIARNGLRILGLLEDLILDIANAGVQLRYVDSTRGWVYT